MGIARCPFRPNSFFDGLCVKCQPRRCERSEAILQPGKPTYILRSIKRPKIASSLCSSQRQEKDFIFLWGNILSRNVGPLLTPLKQRVTVLPEKSALLEIRFTLRPHAHQCGDVSSRATLEGLDGRKMA